MKNFKTILYATDFSESSVPACDYALHLAQLSGARLHVLHVVAELTDQRRSHIQPEAYELMEKEVEVHAVKDLESFCRDKFGDELDYATEVAMGHPVQVILERAEALPADVVVLGTHGRTGIEHAIVGSTAERVVRRSRIPVLTVRSRP